MMARSPHLLAVLLVMGASIAHGQTRTVVGRVFDSITEQPIPLGLVTVKGMDVRDRLRPDGVFVIRVPRGELQFVVTAAGYRTETMKLFADQTTVFVPLAPDVLELETLVVEGRGTGVDRKQLATSTATLSGDVLDQVPAENLLQVLQGRIGGDVRQNSAVPGGNLQLRLRGVTTLLNSSNPLYVIDGVQVSDIPIASGVAAVTVGQSPVSSRISDLNIYDVASIEVLRGAAATSLYGSRGANGVVIIKTKRGRN